MRALLLLAALATSLGAVDVGAKAPDFTLPTAAGGTRSLTQHAGSYVVLEWINHDCPFVKKHYGGGAMQALQQDLAKDGVVWLSIASSAPGTQGHLDAAGWQAITAEKKAAPAAVCLDADGAVGRLYAAKTTPHCYVIAPDGTLIYQGAIDSIASSDAEDVAKATNLVRQAIAESKSGKPVSVPVSKPYGCSVKYAKP